MDKKSSKDKGFLGGKDYQPDKIKDKDLDKYPIDRSEPTATQEVPYTISPDKAPRPEYELETKKSKDRKGKGKRIKTYIAPKTKDLQLKRAYTIRQILLACGILILILGLIISYQNFLNLSSEESSPLESTAYDLMMHLRDYDGLKYEPGHNKPAWDSNKFLDLTSNDISEDLNPGAEFIIEVEDLSSYSIKYDRTVGNRLAWSSAESSSASVINSASDDAFTISMLMNIYVNPEEVHLARVTVTVW